jgi:hypothetical protein
LAPAPHWKVHSSSPVMSTTPPTTAARLPWNSSLADGAEETGAVGQCAGVVPAPAPDHGIARGSTAAKSLLWHCPGGRAVLTRPPSALESKQLTSRSRSRSRRRRDRVDSPKEEATQSARHTARPYLCADWRCFVDGRSRPQQTGSRGTSPPTLGGTQAQHAQPERLSAADHHHAAPPDTPPSGCRPTPGRPETLVNQRMLGAQFQIWCTRMAAQNSPRAREAPSTPRIGACR